MMLLLVAIEHRNRLGYQEVGTRHQMLVCFFYSLTLACTAEVAGARVLVYHSVGFIMATCSSVNRIVIHLPEVRVMRVKWVR